MATDKVSVWSADEVQVLVTLWDDSSLRPANLSSEEQESL